MIDTKKEQEREELHRTIWGIANDLRGSVDGWDFKQYVLGMLFYRYISENFRNYINEGEIEAGNSVKNNVHIGKCYHLKKCVFHQEHTTHVCKSCRYISIVVHMF